MPDESDSNVPRPKRPRFSDLSKETTEDDLWDLDDEDSEPAPATTPAESPQAPPEDYTATHIEAESATAAPEARATESESPATPETPAPAASRASEPAAAPASGTPTRREFIGLIAIAVLCIGGAIWGVLGLFSDVPTSRLGEARPDFPVEGEHATVTRAESFWREPVRDGDGADFARADALFIPVLAVELDDEGSGALRAIFRDDLGEFVGDAITRSFSNGTFDKTGRATAEFPATEGFQEQSGYSAYRAGGPRWTVEILEGPSANAPGREFTRLFEAPISGDRR